MHRQGGLRETHRRNAQRRNERTAPPGMKGDLFTTQPTSRLRAKLATQLVCKPVSLITFFSQFRFGLLPWRVSHRGRAKNVHRRRKTRRWKTSESKHHRGLGCLESEKIQAGSESVQCHRDDMMAHGNPDTGQRSAMTFGVRFGLGGYGHPLQRPVMQKAWTQHSLNNHSTGTGGAGCRNWSPCWALLLAIPCSYGRGEGLGSGALLKQGHNFVLMDQANWQCFF